MGTSRYGPNITISMGAPWRPTWFTVPGELWRDVPTLAFSLLASFSRAVDFFPRKSPPKGFLSIDNSLQLENFNLARENPLEKRVNNRGIWKLILYLIRSMWELNADILYCDKFCVDSRTKVCLKSTKKYVKILRRQTFLAMQKFNLQRHVDISYRLFA